MQTGSIPAGTGEPAPSLIPARAPGVYPRGHGGAFAVMALASRHTGLSPRARGSRKRSSLSSSIRGSIPAGTGEPNCLRPVFGVCRVYPRGHGGASPGLHGCSRHEGLSPRARGSHEGACPGRAPCGSIPAGTGEPCAVCSPTCSPRVYPRGHGGALPEVKLSLRIRGLSPRARGSLSEYTAPDDFEGSIPAGTGEPSLRRARRVGARVYPRGHGGASCYQESVFPTMSKNSDASCMWATFA